MLANAMALNTKNNGIKTFARTFLVKGICNTGMANIIIEKINNCISDTPLERRYATENDAINASTEKNTRERNKGALSFGNSLCFCPFFAEVINPQQSSFNNYNLTNIT